MCRLGKIESTQRVEWPSGVLDGGGDLIADSAHGFGLEQAMPGVLMKSQDDFRPLKPGKRGLAEDMAEPPYKKIKREVLTNGGQTVNGDSAFPNGAQTNGVSPGPPAVEEKPVTGLEGLFDVRLPPEIRQWNSNFVSVSALITRLAQETLNQVVEVVNDMSELKVLLSNGLHGSSQVQMNGNSTASVEDDDNVKKKQLLLDFSHERRTQFIKMLVLLQWSRRSEEVGKAINIFIWMKEQCGHFLGSVGWLKVMRTEMNKIQVPGPDLKTALEALSLGKASWLTDVRHSLVLTIPVGANFDSLITFLWRNYHLENCSKLCGESTPYCPYD